MYLKVHRVTGGYENTPVVVDVSFTLSPGHILTLLGPNGAGKSTLLRVVIGLNRLLHGRLFMDDLDISTFSTEHRVRLGMGYVPEERRTFPGMTVKENLEVASHVSVGLRRQHLEEILTLFPALSTRLKQYGWSLSGGEQQMLVIGRALMTKPKVLLLDEPTFGLAPAVVGTVLNVLPRILKTGTSVIIATENPKLLTSFSAQAVLLNLGRVVFQGPLSDLASTPVVQNDIRNNSYSLEG